MKQLFLFLSLIECITFSCRTPQPIVQNGTTGFDKAEDTTIVQSLFNDRSSSITEDNIQRILDGSYKLASKIRIAIVRLENPRQQHYYSSDEGYMKMQQSYLDSLATRLKASSRVAAIATIPDIIISKSPSFTSIREAAVRMQCDMVLVYTISGDIYSRYKFFSTPDIKAFATAQVMFMDVRTGLIPFSTIVTRDYLSRKTKDDMDFSQTRDRVLNEAGLATINDAGERITGFLAAN